VSRSWLLLLLIGAGGCSWAKRPYADDPLVRGKKAIVGNPIGCEAVEKWDRPCPPAPPPAPGKANDAQYVDARSR
jgi:hypothetical protein